LDAYLAPHQVVEVEAELGPLRLVQHGGDAQRRLLLGRCAIDVLPAQRGRYVADQELALGFERTGGQLKPEIDALHVVLAHRLGHLGVADADPAIDGYVARLHLWHEWDADGDIAVDNALAARQRHARVL